VVEEEADTVEEGEATAGEEEEDSEAIEVSLTFSSRDKFRH